MDDWRPDRAAKKAAIPASSLFLASTFHASIVFLLLSVPLITPPASVPDDAVELTIERQTASAAPVVQPAAPPEPPVVSPPVQPPVPVPQQSAPQVEPAPPPTLESAIPEPEPAPQPTLRDFPKTEPVIARTEQKKPVPKVDPKADPNPEPSKAPVQPPAATPQTAAPPTPPSNQADVDLSKKDERAARLWGTRYFERMGIRPSHQAVLTGTSGRACPLDPQPYKLEIADNKLTVTNDYGVMFSIAVPANGDIDQIYKRPPMAGDHYINGPGKRVEYRMLGNVKSGKLEIWYLGCVYKLNVYG